MEKKELVGNEEKVTFHRTILTIAYLLILSARGQRVDASCNFVAKALICRT